MKNPGAKKIVDLLNQRIRQRKRGIIAAVNRLVRRSSGWWHQRAKAGDISIGQMMAILDHLGLDPVRFMRDAVGRKDGLELDRPRGDAPEIVRRAWKRFSQEGDRLETVGEANLKTLNALRYQEPRKALDQASTLVEFCPQKLLPGLLGVAGSAYRLLLQLRQAEHAIYAGVRMAQRIRDLPMMAGLLQKLAYVLAEGGQPDAALVLAEKATTVFLHSSSEVGVARSLVDQGIWLRLLGRQEESLSVLKIALKWLPEEECHNRAAALQYIGLNLRDLGQLQIALRYAEESELAAVALPRGELDRARWLKANITADLGDLEPAAEVLREVVQALAEIHLGDMALAALDLVRVEVLRGNLQEAYQVARVLTRLLEPLRKNRTISGAIAELLRDGERGLSLALAQDVRNRIEGELKHRPLWRSLWVES